ncbi:possible high light inducible protein [Synechococcus sp. CC9311]|nr:possible high light inducible protein [Synechococcus sp. CC9311]
MRLPPFRVQGSRSRPIRSQSETFMTSTTLRAPTGLVTRDGEGHGNIYAKEPRMEYATADAGWGFHSRAEKLNGRLAMLGFVAAIATEMITGEGLLRTIGL